MIDTGNLIRRFSIVCEEMNAKFNHDLIEKEFLNDLNNNNEALVSYLEQFETGIQKLEGNMKSISSSQDECYTEGIVDLFLALDGLIENFSEMDKILSLINKKFMYKSGEITLEEYLDDGVIELEDANDEDDL